MTEPTKSSNAPSVGVCITGMHRSGTSLTAAWLERCGLPIADGKMMGANVGNPHGHFEDMDFYELQRNAMTRLHVSWRVTDPRPLAFGADELAQARALIQARSQRFPRWGWKDPRSLFFFHDWKRLSPNLKALIVWRPCVEVVRSLRERAAAKWWRLANAIDPLTAARAWAAYNQLALALLQEFPDDVLLVSVRALVAQDKAVVDRCNEAWSLDLSHVPIAQVRDESLLQTQQTLTSRLAAEFIDAGALERELAARSFLRE